MSAPSVILIHGFLDAGAVWAPLVASLGTKAEGWLAPDLAGMGTRAADAGPYTLPRYAADITRLIDQTEGPLVLVAHSMGAQIAELAALARPERVRALALLCPVPLGGPHAPPELTEPLAATGGDVAAQREARRSLMASPANAQALEQLTALGSAVRRSATEALVKAWNEGVPEGRAPSAFPGPVLVLSGELDPFVTPQMARGVAARFAHASQDLVKGAGHWPQTEQPLSAGQAIADFLAPLAGAPASAKAEAGWQGAFSAQTEKSFGDSFDADVLFEATVMARPVKGRERVQTILGAASRLYEALEFTHKSKDGDHSFLEWEARIVGGEPVSGITILTANDQGKIVRIAIHHRPLSGALHFSSGLQTALAGKIEADLFYSPVQVTAG